LSFLLCKLLEWQAEVDWVRNAVFGVNVVVGCWREFAVLKQMSIFASLFYILSKVLQNGKKFG
jgi:hypothetical protein